LQGLYCSIASDEDDKECTTSHRAEVNLNTPLSEQPHWCTVQQNFCLDEEKSKHAGLAQQNGFELAFLHRMLRLANCTALTPTVDWLDGLIVLGGLLLVGLPTFN